MGNKNYMTEMTDVELNNKLYTTRIVNIADYGDRRIAGESLQDAIFVNGKYASDIAKVFDESIFFYVPDEYLQKSDIELAEYVESQLD